MPSGEGAAPESSLGPWSCEVCALIWRDQQRCSPFLSHRFWASSFYFKLELLLCRGTIFYHLPSPLTPSIPYYLLGIHIYRTQTVQAQCLNFTGFLSILTMTLEWGHCYYIIILSILPMKEPTEASRALPLSPSGVGSGSWFALLGGSYKAAV